jgi:hypothetical protein
MQRLPLSALGAALRLGVTVRAKNTQIIRTAVFHIRLAAEPFAYLFRIVRPDYRVYPSGLRRCHRQ